MFGASINGIVPLTVICICLLLVYENVIDLCVFNLYSVTLLNSLISSKRFFFVDSLEFSNHVIVSSGNGDSFTSSFLIIALLWGPSVQH